MLFILLEPIFEHFEKKRIAKLRLKNADKFEAAVQAFFERRRQFDDWIKRNEKDENGRLVQFKQTEIDVPEGYDWGDVLCAWAERQKKS